ncbi:pitrilysin family protein [Haloferula sp. BvORR071]|uniref:M16 family metallopeptidase n=1 Tax=Haloferula sp. BvORR071 TaxID=1396141 RepID=UPI0009463E9D|nr:pitrilysin family protein [Haloferula sp. BvORR071]
MQQRALPFLVIAISLSPAHAEIGGFKEIRSLGGITEYRLDANGLTALLMPEKSAPVVTYMTTFRIGSRNESYGTTGATHLLEHLMFKGTAKHNKEAGNGYDQLLESTGAELNATTWLDRTNYFCTLGPQDLPVVVELEADRMRNLRLREEDRRPEMTVVRNEFERAENDPETALTTELWATAYLAHPYRHSVLGWRSDVEKVPIEKLKAFYDTYYWPDNATISVVGDFEADSVLKLIAEKYAVIPKAPHAIPEVYTEEPEQTGPRRVMVKRPGELGVVSIAFKSPTGRDADYPALTVLCDLLCNGKGSRLYKTLTDEGLTTDVSAYSEFTRDPSLLTVSAEITPDSDPATVERKIHEVLDKLIAGGVSDKEVKMAIARLKAEQAFARDGSQAMSNDLSNCISVGDWTLYLREQETLEAVTAADVQRVAKKWLVKERSTTGWYVPKKEKEEEGKKNEAGEAAPQISATPLQQQADLILPEIAPAPPMEVAKIAPRVSRGRSGGLDLLVCPTGVKEVVTISGGFPCGAPGEEALAAFTARLLDKGTTMHDSDAITAMLDAVGATMEFTAADGNLNFSARCLKKDLPLVISLLGEQLRTPAFKKEEIAKERTQLLADTAQTRSDTSAQAAIAFSRAAFPAGHPNRDATTDETIAALKKIQRGELEAFHKKWFGPAAATLVVVGDVEPAACQAEVEKAFQGWSGGLPHATAAVAPALGSALDVKVAVPGKESASVLLGQPVGLNFRDPDVLPLSLATAVLGQGFTSRLLSTVRDAEGLTYGLEAGMWGDTTVDGAWEIESTFAPQLVEEGLKSVRRELEKWHDGGLTPAELAYRKSVLIGRHRVGLATTTNVAGALLATVRRGLPLSWLDDYPAQVSALTLEQVNEVVKRRLDPAKMITVKSGSLP